MIAAMTFRASANPSSTRKVIDALMSPVSCIEAPVACITWLVIVSCSWPSRSCDCVPQAARVNEWKIPRRTLACTLALMRAGKDLCRDPAVDVTGPVTHVAADAKERRSLSGGAPVGQCRDRHSEQLGNVDRMQQRHYRNKAIEKDRISRGRSVITREPIPRTDRCRFPCG